MSEAIEKFVFAGANEVKVVMKNDKPWFVAKDVCDILGTRTCDVKTIVGEKRVSSVNPDTIGVGNHGGRDMLIVNESGLYSLVLKSKKPGAVKFQDWVVDEVLPSIRKHGAYMTDRTLAIMKDDPDYIYKVAEMLVEEKRQRMIAEGERDEAVRTKAWISDRKTATALQRNSVYSRRINSLEREKAELIDRLDEIDEELDTQRQYANRYFDWRSKVGRKPKGYVRPEDDMTDYLM